MAFPQPGAGCRKALIAHWVELVGESVREIGILLLVFVPLDATFYEGKIDLTAQIGLAILAMAGLALIAVGVLIEAKKPTKNEGK